MKHFEPQYNERGDSPVDLSGREGADKADAILDDIDTVLESLRAPSFSFEWATAPREIQEQTTQEAALHFYEGGRMNGLTEAAIQFNNDMQELLRARKERL